MMSFVLSLTIWPLLLSQQCLASEGSAEVGAAPAAVTVVTTAQQLKDAVVRGDAYVEIQDHLDLSTVDPVDFRILGIPPKTVKSINGNCGPLPSMEAFNLTGAPLLPAAAPSCLIATDKDLLYAWEGSLWLSNLYVRLKRTPRTDLPIMLHVNRGPAGELWVTDCTFQGDGEDSCRALYSDSSAFLLRTTVAHMGRREASVVVRSGRNSLNFRLCTFIAAPEPPAAAVADGAADGGEDEAADGAADGQHAPVLQAHVASFVRLEGVRFSGFGNIFMLRDAQGTSHFFSDAELPVWNEELQSDRMARPLVEAEAEDVFLSMDDPFIRQLQKDLATLPRKSGAAPPQATLRRVYTSAMEAIEKLPLEKLPLESLPGAELGKGPQVVVLAAAALVPLLVLLWLCCRPRASKPKKKQS